MPENNELKKTMAHRKQVRPPLPVNSHHDEIPLEPEEPISLYSDCQMESTGDKDDWILCT